VFIFNDKSVVLVLLISLCGCATLVTPVAGNFMGEPAEMPDEISPGAKALIESAFSGFGQEAVIDSHVHIVGLGAGGSGIWINPAMKEGFDLSKRIKFAAYKSASGIKDDEHADQEYIDRLIAQIKAMRPNSMKLFILAFDKHYTKAGIEDLSHTSFYVPNDYVVELGLRYPQFFIPVASIHPYRKDALDELETMHQSGVKYIKWLPNSQGIDPADEAVVPFYKKMAEYDMVLISHTGEERAVESENYQRLGNPQRLRLPLRYGVKVIMAHLATLGTCHDMDNHDREATCFELALAMLENPEYKTILFADISAVTQSNRAIRLAGILNDQSLHHRLVNGSDYPLPAINILYKTTQLESMGFISEQEKDQLNEIYSYNPLLFDFVLKRTVKSPVEKKSFMKQAFELPANI
jgi:predicted TIM-barrel fold metal-dependent hydrolase